MRSRMLLMTLYSVALLSLAGALRLPIAAWPLLLMAAIPGVFRRIPPAVRFAIEIIVVTLMIVVLARPWAVVLAVVMAMASLSIARSQRPSADRAILGSVPIVVVASFINPAVAWSFFVLAAIAVVALVTSQEAEKQMEPQRLRLAVSIALVAGLGATAAGLIIHLLPWQTVLATTFSVVAYPFIAVFSHIHLPAHSAAQNPLRSSLTSHHLKSGIITHAPAILTVTFVIAALILLALLLYAAFRYWARNDDNMEPSTSDRGIVREDLTDEIPDFFRQHRQRLKPVRSLVATRLRQAHRVYKGRKPSETLREWMARNQSDIDNQVLRLYEDIRYGDADDTIAKRREAQALWPRP